MIHYMYQVIIILIILTVSMSWLYFKKAETIKELTTELEKKTNELNLHNNDLKQKNKSISEINEALQHKKNIIKTLTVQMEDRNHTINKITNQLAEKNQDINQYRYDLQQREQAVGQYKNKLHEYKDKVNQYNLELSQLTSDKKAMNDELLSHQRKLREIESLKTELLAGLSKECKKDPLSQHCIVEYELIHALKLLNRTEKEIINAYKIYYTPLQFESPDKVNAFIDSLIYDNNQKNIIDKLNEERNKAKLEYTNGKNNLCTFDFQQKINNLISFLILEQAKTLEPNLNINASSNATKVRYMVLSTNKIIEGIKSKYCKTNRPILHMVDEIYDVIIDTVRKIKKGITLQTFSILDNAIIW